MHVRPLTPAIGAEISDVNLGDASRDEGIQLRIRQALRLEDVLFQGAKGFRHRMIVAHPRDLRMLQRKRQKEIDAEKPRPKNFSQRRRSGGQGFFSIKHKE